MGGRGGKSGLQSPRVATTDAQGFKDTDNADFHQLYNGQQYYNQQNIGIDLRMAFADYTSAAPTLASGYVYSPSQDLNYAMKEGNKLTANQQFMVDEMNAAMHNLGYNLNLQRYARVDFMDRLGIQNYAGMSESQLQQALVGKTYKEDGMISTSYNQFKNAPNGGAPFTDKAVKINYKAPAATQALMPPIGQGGSLGEIVLKPNQNYKVTGVRYTGKRGRSGGQWYPQVELDVEVGPNKK